MKNSNIRKVTKTILFLIVKPFIIPILIIVILLAFACSITDIFYIAFNNEYKIDMKKEMKYYDTEKEYEKEEMKTFLSSVWDFVEKIFGGGEMAEKTDWPVEGYYKISSGFGPRKAPTGGASTNHSRN